MQTMGCLGWAQGEARMKTRKPIRTPEAMAIVLIKNN